MCVRCRHRCRHRRKAVNFSGGYHYSAGEVWDNVRETLVCLECGSRIPGPGEWKERSRWYYGTPATATLSEELPPF